MSEVPYIKEEYIVSAAARMAVQHLLKSQALDAREVFIHVRLSNPITDDQEIQRLFIQQLQQVGVEYLIARN